MGWFTSSPITRTQVYTLWMPPLEASHGNTPAGLGGTLRHIAKGVLYLGGFDGNVYAFNASTGTQIWTSAIGSGAMQILRRL